jgi:hypothetical protein
VSTACPDGTQCNGAGKCAPTCLPGTTLCGDGECHDLTTDNADCGACSTTMVSTRCPDGTQCNGAGVCAPTCLPGTRLCGDGKCHDLTTDNANCGACSTAGASTACPDGTQCNGAGVCAPTCLPGTTLCGDGKCHDLRTDNADCGACSTATVSTACTDGNACSGGLCLPTCLPGTTLCGDGKCHDLTTDNANCGACSTAAVPTDCGPGTRCSGSACGVACGTGSTLCPDGRCHDLSDDSGNCKTCGNACPTGQLCQASACVPLEPSSCAELHALEPSLPDGDYPLYLGNDASKPYTAHCTGMTTATPATYLTLINTGATANASGYTAGGATGTTTVLTLWTRVRFDPATLTIDNSDYTFSSSTGFVNHENTTQVPYGVARDCRSNFSMTGNAYLDLRGLPFTIVNNWATNGFNPGGVQTFTSTSQVAHITGGGFCGWDAPNGNGDSVAARNGGPGELKLVYQSGLCGASVYTCSGTCVDPSRDNANCGACGTVCGTSATCVAGACAVNCGSGLMACSSQCINPATDPDHCGACATVCAATNVSTRACVSGLCFPTCTSGFADCDGNPQNGCETTANTVAHCGTCAPCPSGPNTVASCASGTCGLTCVAGYRPVSSPINATTGCTDINECTNGTNNCSPNATCTNTAGSFTCACNVGFTGNGVTCTDINECTSGANNCSANATCTNTPGGFTCACKPGYSGNGFTCNDIDECAANPCSSHATCTNTPGSFTCTCNAGYSGNGITCNDINECLTNTCSPNASCVNTPGNFTCTCKAGFSGNGLSCAPGSGLRFWVRADAGVTTGATFTWADQSGNNDNVSISTAGLQPQLVTNVINGLPVVRFSGGQRLESAATAFNFGTGDLTWFHVSSLSGAVSGKHQVFGTLQNGGTFSGITAGYGSAGNQAYGMFRQATDNFIVDPTPVTFNAFNILDARRLSAAVTINLNGGMVASGTSTDSLGGGTMTVGAERTGGAEFMLGDIAEILVYNGALSDADRTAVESYLSGRYAITVGHSIGGTVSGLGAGQSVVLQNNGGDNTTVSSNTTFTFPTLVADGAAYNVTAIPPPGDGCFVTNGSGTATASVSNVAVTCGPASCLSIHRADPTLPSAVYTIHPQNIAPFDVFCDMVADGGGWAKILQIAGSAYTPNVAAVGTIAVANVPAFAKLSDAQVNAIGGAGTSKLYRLKGTQSPANLYVSTANSFNDLDRSSGLNTATGPLSFCEAPSYPCPLVAAPNVVPFLDTYSWKGSNAVDDSCDRYFDDVRGNPDCWNPSNAAQRCVNAGVSCGAGYPLINSLTIWVREQLPVPLFEEQFEGLNGGSTGLQCSTNDTVYAFADLPNWTKAGTNALHGVQWWTAGSDKALQLFDSNSLIMNTGVPANLAGAVYQVSFLGGPANWASCPQGTQAGDFVTIDVLRADGSTLKSFNYGPPAWSGTEVLTPFAFTYTGDGSGLVRLRITDPLAVNRLAAAIDDLAIYGPGATSCQAIHQYNPTLPDGMYTIYINGVATPAFCDMTSSGGGWTQVLDQDVTVAPSYQPNATWLAGVNPNNPNSGQYSILPQMANLKSGTNYEFRIDWPTAPATGSVQWTQVENPITAPQTPTISNVIENPPGQQGCGTFRGLAQSTGGQPAALHGDSNFGGCWWWAIGTSAQYGVGIPGYYNPGGTSGTIRARLWVR